MTSPYSALVSLFDDEKVEFEGLLENPEVLLDREVHMKSVAKTTHRSGRSRSLPGGVKCVEAVRLAVGNAGEDDSDNSVIEFHRLCSCRLIA